MYERYNAIDWNGRSVTQTGKTDVFLAILLGRNCTDFTYCSVIIFPSFRMKAFDHCTYNFIGRWINLVHVLCAAVRRITDMINGVITIVATPIVMRQYVVQAEINTTLPKGKDIC